MESGGQYGDSSIGLLNIDAGKSAVTHQNFHKIDRSVFAEGLDIPSDDFAYQLTWTNNKIFAWKTNLVSSEPSFIAPFPQGIREGWGLTHDPENSSQMYWSDGSSYIYRISLPKPGVAPQVYQKIRVTENGQDLSQLNELEYIEGYIWANVYLSNRIVKINPETGKVTQSYDLSSLERDANDDLRKRFGRNLWYGECLNGIAFDPKSRIWYITGKMWPRIYMLKFD